MEKMHSSNFVRKRVLVFNRIKVEVVEGTKQPRSNAVGEAFVWCLGGAKWLRDVVLTV